MPQAPVCGSFLSLRRGADNRLAMSSIACCNLSLIECAASSLPDTPDEPHSKTLIMNHKQGPLSYSDAGVDIDAGNALVQRIKPLARRTHRPEVLAGPGGFGALCQIPPGYTQPLLVSGTDGVGTKLRLAMDLDRHEGIGIDLVAMCVNDLVVCGAEPLFFLDYYATGHLNLEVATRVVDSIATGCSLAGCALVGGETAEMPGMYQGEDYDLAGFCVGVVEKTDVIDGQRVRPGDALIALASSGAHANGYSLIRKILETQAPITSLELAGCPMADVLLEPTRIYVKSVRQLIQQGWVHALCHITGGGLLENLPRVLPADTRALIDTTSWVRPPLFDWLQQTGQVTEREMFRTLNMGVGMVAAVPQQQAQNALDCLHELGEQAWQLGTVAPAAEAQDAVTLEGLQ